MLVRKFLVRMALSAGFLALFSLKFIDVSIGEHFNEYPLEAAWKTIGLPLKEVTTESWMQLNNRWMSVYQLRELAAQIEAKMRLRLNGKPTYGEQDGITFASLEGALADGTLVTVTVQSSQTKEDIGTQMGINTVHQGPVRDFPHYVGGLKEKIMAFTKTPHFKVLLNGEYQGKLRAEVIREFSCRAFRKIKAELIETAYDAGNSYQKGYTGLIREAVKYDTRQVNVEIGTRYDSSRNTTEIVMASPSLGD
ncbi:MAG: YwmB family TATA-box binding protein [Bacillota bacterium]